MLRQMLFCVHFSICWMNKCGQKIPYFYFKKMIIVWRSVKDRSNRKFYNLTKIWPHFMNNLPNVLKDNLNKFLFIKFLKSYTITRKLAASRNRTPFIALGNALWQKIYINKSGWLNVDEFIALAYLSTSKAFTSFSFYIALFILLAINLMLAFSNLIEQQKQNLQAQQTSLNNLISNFTKLPCKLISYAVRWKLVKFWHLFPTSK